MEETIKRLLEDKQPSAYPIMELHAHTYYSDGVVSPTNLVLEAARKGVEYLAITDHDTLEGIDEAIMAAQPFGIRIIPGIELSSTVGGKSIHMLGLALKGYSKMQQEPLVKKLIKGRRDRAELHCHELERLGFDIKFEDVDVKGTHGKAQVVEALLKKNSERILSEVKEFKTFGPVIDYYFKEGPIPYIPNFKIDYRDAIDLIHDYGGLAVLAHPAIKLKRGAEDSLIVRMIDYGLDGLEVFHKKHSFEDAAHYANMARKARIFMTAGTDYHGHDGSRPLGTLQTFDDQKERLLDRLG